MSGVKISDLNVKAHPFIYASVHGFSYFKYIKYSNYITCLVQANELNHYRYC